MPLDEQAIFCRPEEPDKEIAGRLVFDDDGGRVELFGDLGGPEMFIEPEGWQRTRRLIAVSQNKRFTLDGCYFRSGRTIAIGSGLDKLALNVQIAIEGICFEADEELTFTGIKVNPRYLERWSPKDWLSETTYFRQQEEYGHAILKVNHVESETAQVGDIAIKLGNSFTVSGDRYATRSLHNVRFFEITVDELRPFDEVADIAQDFQALVTIGTGRIAAFDTAFVYHPAVESPDKKHRLPLAVYRRWRVTPVDSKPPEPEDLYFTYADLGGIGGVGNWLTMAGKYRDVLGRVMATRYNTHLHLEDRALNRFVALEGFHRTWSQKDEMKYRERLIELAVFAGDPFGNLVGRANVETWAKLVVRERNKLAHHFGRSAGADTTPLLFHLSQAAYWLAVLCFLRESQAPEIVFERWSKNSNIVNFTENMDAVLKTL